MSVSRAPNYAAGVDRRRALPGVDQVMAALDGLPHELLAAWACGAGGGLIVNNNAAAVLVALAALARGRAVVVSRGELVEIGGGFRVPEIMAESGARLVEVGTTNRTRREDYQDAIGPDTAL